MLPLVFDSDRTESTVRDLDAEAAGVSEEGGRLLPGIGDAYAGQDEGYKELVLSEEATEFGGATDGKGRSGNMAKQANENAGRGALSATQKRTQRKYKAMARARGEVWEEG